MLSIISYALSAISGACFISGMYILSGGESHHGKPRSNLIHD